MTELGWKDGTDRREDRLVMFYKIVTGSVAVEVNDYLTPGSICSRNNLKYTTVTPGNNPPPSQPQSDAESVEAFKSQLE